MAKKKRKEKSRSGEEEIPREFSTSEDSNTEHGDNLAEEAPSVGNSIVGSELTVNQHKSRNMEIIKAPICTGYDKIALVKFSHAYEDYKRKWRNSDMGMEPASRLSCVPNHILKTWWRYMMKDRPNTVEEITDAQWCHYVDFTLKTQTSQEASTLETTLRRIIMDIKLTNAGERLHDYLVRFNKQAEEISALSALEDDQIHIKLLVEGVRPYRVRDSLKSQLRTNSLMKKTLSIFMQTLTRELTNFCIYEYADRPGMDYSKEKGRGVPRKVPDPQRPGLPKRPRLPKKEPTKGQEPDKKGPLYKRNGTDLVECYQCKGNHYINDCPTATKEEKAESRRRLKQRRAKRMNPVNMDQRQLQHHVRVNCKASYKYLADSGSTHTLLSEKICTEVGAVVKYLKVPEKMDLALEGVQGTCVGTTTVDLEIGTICGNVVVRKVVCDVTDSTLTEILLGNDLLVRLGINVEQQLADLAMEDSGNVLDPVEEAEESPLIGEIDKNEIIEQLELRKDCAKEAGLPEEYLKALSDYLNEYWNCFRIRMGNDPPASVPAMKVHWDEGSCKPIICKSRRYPEQHRRFMDYYTEMLESYDMIYKNNRSRFCSPVFVVNKVPNPTDITTDYRLTIDSREPNKVTDRFQFPMPNMEVCSQHLRKAKYYISLDLKHGYWLCLLDPSCRELFSFATHKCVYTPKRVIQGAADSVLYFQSMMQEVFSEKLYNGIIVWLDDLLLYAETIKELFDLLAYVLGKCKETGLKLAVRKSLFFAQEIVWCGRVIREGTITHDPARIAGLVNLPAPTQADGLMKFINAANWMRTSLPNFATIMAPLYDKLAKALGPGQKRTKQRAKKIELSWSSDELLKWDLAKKMIVEIIPLSIYDPANELLLYTDASQDGWAIVLMQCPDFDEHKSVLDQGKLQPLAFLSGTYKGPAAHYAINEKEAYPIIEALDRFRDLLLTPKGFRLYCDHRNLIYMFSDRPGLKLPTRSKLQRWALKLQGYNYQIEHIDGDLNLWADILSRWLPPVSNVPVSKLAAVKRPIRRTTQPLLQPLKELPWPTFSVLQAAQDSVFSESSFQKNEAGLFVNNKSQILIPHDDTALQHRLLIIAHYMINGHRRVKGTWTKLRNYCIWPTMEQDVERFVQECLYCKLVKTRKIIPRPFGDRKRAEERNQRLHFDYLTIGPSITGKEYILVLKDDFSHFTELVLTETPDSASAVDAILAWVARFGIPRDFMSDQGPHFRSEVIEILKNKLSINHDFSTVYCAWANGAIERVNREILDAIKILLMELGYEHRKWPDIIKLVQFGLNQTPADSLGGHTPTEVFTALPPSDPLALVFDRELNKFVDVPLSLEEIERHCKKLKNSLEQMHGAVKEGTEKMDKRNRKQRDRSAVPLFPFEIGDYVIWSRVDRQGPKGKLYCTWLGPMVIVDTESDYVYKLKDLLTGKEFPAHISRMDFYSDDKLEVSEELKALLSRQGFSEYVIEKIGKLEYNKTYKRYEFLVHWSGFDEIEDSLESFESLFNQVPILVLEFLNMYFKNEPELVTACVQQYNKLITTMIQKKKLNTDEFLFLKKR